jgi:cystathionine beta-lyase
VTDLDRRPIVDLTDEEARRGHDNAAAVALERGRVTVSPGANYASSTTGQVRLNIATSPARLTEIVERLARAWR